MPPFHPGCSQIDSRYVCCRGNSFAALFLVIWISLFGLGEDIKPLQVKRLKWSPESLKLSLKPSDSSWPFSHVSPHLWYLCVCTRLYCMLRVHHVSVIFSSDCMTLCCSRSCRSLGKCHCCQSVCSCGINVPFSWQYSECLYDRVYVNEPLAIDQHLVLLHSGTYSSGQETNTHTHKSPQFSWICMRVGKDACQYHLLCLAAFVLYIFAHFLHSREGEEKEGEKEREQQYWAIGNSTTRDRGFIDWSVDRLHVQTEPGCLCVLGPAFPSLSNATFSSSALQCVCVWKGDGQQGKSRCVKDGERIKTVKKSECKRKCEE